MSDYSTPGGFLRPNFDAIPSQLKTLDQWFMWRAEQRPSEPGKFQKRPRNLEGVAVSKTDPGQMNDFDSARATFEESEGRFTGVGISLLRNGVHPGERVLICIDLDHVRDPKTGEIEPWAQQIIMDLDSYTEASPSGKGVHIWAFGEPPAGNRNRDLDGIEGQRVEFYGAGAFLTVTGCPIGKALHVIDHTDKLKQLYARLGTEHEQSSTYERESQPGGHETYFGKFAEVDLDTLPISERTKQLIREGTPKSSRSETVYSAICTMVNAGLDNTVIRSVLTDRRYGLSKKALEERHGNRVFAAEWLLPQIEKAHATSTKAGAYQHTGGGASAQPPPSAADDDKRPEWLRDDVFDRIEAEVSDMLATPAPPQRYLVENLIPAECVGVLAAATKTGKSFWGLELSVLASIGAPFFGFRIPEPFPVVYLNGEDSRADFHRRLKAIYLELGLAEKQLQGFWPFLLAGQDCRLTGMVERDFLVLEGVVDRLCELILRKTQVKGLVIVDTLARFHGGLESNEHLTVFVKALERIRELTGWSVLAMHHISQQATLNGQNLDLMAVRGGTALVSNTRFHLAMQTMTEAEAKSYGIEQGDRQQYVQLASGGFNYGPALGSAWFRRIKGGVLVKVTLERIPQGKAEQPELYNNIVEFVTDELVAGRYYSKRGFCEQYGGTENRFAISAVGLRTAVAKLITDKKLTLMNRPRYLANDPNYKNIPIVLATPLHAQNMKLQEAENETADTADTTADTADIRHDDDYPP